MQQDTPHHSHVCFAAISSNLRLNLSRYDRATASFYRAFNAVFGKIGRSSSEEVVLQLINSKCMPCLLYALEACPIDKTQKSHWNLL